MLTEVEDAVSDSVAELECPVCGCVMRLELDAGEYNCEECGEALCFYIEDCLI